MVKSCCCGCLSLRSGSMTIALLRLINDCICFISILASVSAMDTITFSLWNYGSEKTFARVLIGLTCYFFAMVVVDSLLVHGIRKRKRVLMIPWLCMALLELVLALLLFIMVFVVATQVIGEAVFLVIMFVSFIAFFAIPVHFFDVVYFYFKELGVEGESQGQSMQPFYGLGPSPSHFPGASQYFQNFQRQGQYLQRFPAGQQYQNFPGQYLGVQNLPRGGNPSQYFPEEGQRFQRFPDGGQRFPDGGQRFPDGGQRFPDGGQRFQRFPDGGQRFQNHPGYFQPGGLNPYAQKERY
ncbi:unnamed protein product [Darwinula stevensoni]|uniref:Uncharacterized protein n=1 Tax=Darwinula stevensoni TaxID=69355 RepID=A0A7R9ACB5_9CRUS|nr:unnamed protein product [Darwinula stevensoni]CAG0900223.1 unnamed protein product [Darwinula stevensoni]